MQKRSAVGRRVKILDKKNRGGGGSMSPPANLRVNSFVWTDVEVTMARPIHIVPPYWFTVR